MEPEQIGEIIASRKLTLVDGNNELFVEIGRPQPFPDSGYHCPIRMSGIGINKIKQVGGVDAMQALQLALQIIKVDLAAINKQLNHALRWSGETDLGF